MLRKLSLGMLLAVMLATVSLSRPMSGVTVAIGPKTAYVVATFDKQFSTYVSGAMNPALTWSVNSIVGGNAAVGTISATGKYTAPAGVPAGTQFAIQAASVEDPTAVANATVVIVNPSATISALNPWTVAVGTTFTLQVTGSNIVNGATINWAGVPLPTIYVNANTLKATTTANSAGSVNIQIQNPASLPSSILSLAVMSSGGGTPPPPSTPPPPPPPPPITVNVVPGVAGTPPGGSQQFTATVNNSANQTVTWRVNGTPGGDPGNGLITATGLYTAPANVPSPNVVTISALAAANGSSVGSATLTIQNPQAITWARFLDQATYGPTPALMGHVQQVGFEAFITEQFGMPEGAWPDGDRSTAINSFYSNAGNSPDQLRQRVIGALSEIIVEAENKNTNGDEIIPYLRILSKDALGNYRQLLKDITIDASMGHYLDLAQSNVFGGAPNENYPREIMQLFSIGLVQLNQDGSIVLDASNQPIPTYSQFDVQQMAKAMAGWTYDNATHTPGPHGSYFPGPMVPSPGAHIIGPKTVLGVTIPSGQTAMQDIDSAIDILMNHPNIAPFIATRLIRALVTSNPSPAYIKAVADKFVDNGQGIKGDMQAVVHEILMNAEARNDNPPANFGRLRNPMQFFISTAHALGWGVGGASGFQYLMYNMNFGILDPASVFGHYSPLFKIPQSGGLFGPEFQVYSASDAVNRAQFLYSELYRYPFNPAISPYINLAQNPQALIDSVDNALMYGRMSQNLRSAIASSLAAMPDDNQRAIEALYLTAMSGEYLIQR